MDKLGAPQLTVIPVHIIGDMLRLTHQLQTPHSSTSLPENVKAFLSHLKFAQTRANDSHLDRLSHQIDMSASILSDQTQMIVKFNAGLQSVLPKDSSKHAVLETLVNEATRVVVAEAVKVGDECLTGQGLFTVQELLLGKSKIFSYKCV